MDPSPWRPNQDNTTRIHSRSQPCPVPSTPTLPHIWAQDFPEAFSSSGFIWEQVALVKITLCSRTENKMSRQTKHLHFPNILKSSGVSRDGWEAKGPGPSMGGLGWPCISILSSFPGKSWGDGHSPSLSPMTSLIFATKEYISFAVTSYFLFHCTILF